MKFLTALIIALAATVAQAGRDQVTYDWPSVEGLSVNNACATANTFKSLKPISYCTETKVDRWTCTNGEAEFCRPLKGEQKPSAGEYLKEEVRCVAYGARAIEVSRAVKTTKCTESAPINEAHHGQCLKWTTVNTLIELNFSVAKYLTESAEAGPQFVGFENFTVPQCKK